MNVSIKFAAALDAIPYSLIALFLRVVAAHPFFVSGQTKVEGPTIGRDIFGADLTVQIPTAIRDATFALFAEEYKLPFISPSVAAYIVTALEVVLPVLLLLGLLTRLSALGLLAMTLIIQIFVYPDAWWTAQPIGPRCSPSSSRAGRAISLDHLVFRR